MKLDANICHVSGHCWQKLPVLWVKGQGHEITRRRPWKSRGFHPLKRSESKLTHSGEILLMFYKAVGSKVKLIMYMCVYVNAIISASRFIVFKYH